MTNYRFADVVLVPFPFTDQSATKKRPAVVVSSELFHREHANVIVLAISSQHRPAAETEPRSTTGGAPGCSIRL